MKITSCKCFDEKITNKIGKYGSKLTVEKNENNHVNIGIIYYHNGIINGGEYLVSDGRYCPYCGKKIEVSD